MKASTRFGRYVVEYESGDEAADYEGRPQCWVNCAGFSASLEALRQTGEMGRSDGSTLKVPKGYIEKIEAWAVAQGYDKEIE